MTRQHRLGILVAVATAFAYGAYPAAVRGVYAHGGNAGFAVLASTIARTLGVVLFCLFTKKALFTSRYDTKIAVIGGFFQAMTVICIFM
ncbi:MAG: hypothetical protein JWM96_1007, partial [Alphaproteobacteria bacterium]|nr:hypothetical protein [Alphaproteobacteria bacterium]